MLAGRSPFDIVGHADNPDQNTEDYLFQGKIPYFHNYSVFLVYSSYIFSRLAAVAPVNCINTGMITPGKSPVFR